MRYATIGYGRCGSHWVCNHIAAMTGLPIVNGIDQWESTPSILHTHDTLPVLNQLIPHDHLVIICLRHNSFDALISWEVANRINEWYFYTDRQIDPFRVNPVTFRRNLRIHRYSQDQLVEIARSRNVPHVICIYKELRARAERAGEYIADLVSIAPPRPDYRSPEQHINPRDYSKLITNYNQLKDIWESLYHARR